MKARQRREQLKQIGSERDVMLAAALETGGRNSPDLGGKVELRPAGTARLAPAGTREQ